MKVNPYASLEIARQNTEKKKASEGFLDLLKKEIENVDADQKAAKQKLLDVATGKDPDLVGLTLAGTKAELSFKLLLQVRNKILEAYHEIMRMQL
jgi:flagellar hook-basal body complex protein FliE